MIEHTSFLLHAESLVTGYGARQVLNGVSIDVGFGEIVALIGHNGSGKSTLLKAVFGAVPIWAGTVALDGEELPAPVPRDLLGKGVTYVPQGNRVFGDLTVRENLEIGGLSLPTKGQLTEGFTRVFNLFPALRSRLHQRAATLSGGEKQMLALASVLMKWPRLLLLDEPSLGLAPQLVAAALQQIRRVSYESGAAVLIVEQKVREVLGIAERAYVLRNGQVAFSGPARSLRDEARLREVYF